MTNADKIAELQRQIDELKAQREAPPPQTPEERERENAAYRDQLHQARERAANNFRFSPAVQREMNAACSTADIQDQVRALRAPQGPDYQGVIPSSQTITGGHWLGRGFPGDGTGWRDARPLSNPPGINHVDRLMDEQDRRDRAELAKKLKGG